MGMSMALVAARQQRTGKASRSFSVDPLRGACALYSLTRFEEGPDAFETALRHAGRPGRTWNVMTLAWEALGRVADAERFTSWDVRWKEWRCSARLTRNRSWRV